MLGMDRNSWFVIGIVGSRRRDSFEDEQLVFDQMVKLWKKDKTIICSGACGQGGDRFARKIAYCHHLPYMEFPAEWTRKGKSAGYQRNGIIAAWSDVLIACVSSDRKGGTEDTIKKFLKEHTEEDLYLV